MEAVESGTAVKLKKDTWVLAIMLALLVWAVFVEDPYFMAFTSTLLIVKQLGRIARAIREK